MQAHCILSNLRIVRPMNERKEHNLFYIIMLISDRGKRLEKRGGTRRRQETIIDTMKSSIRI